MRRNVFFNLFQTIVKNSINTERKTKIFLIENTNNYGVLLDQLNEELDKNEKKSEEDESRKNTMKFLKVY